MQNQRAQNLAPVGAAPAKRPGGAVAAVPVSMRRVILVGTLSSVVRQTGAPRHVVDRLALRDPGVRRYDVALDREFSTVWSGGCRIPWRGKTAAKFSMAWKIRKNGGRARPRLGNGLSLWHAALSRADPGNCAGREPRATGAGGRKLGMKNSRRRGTVGSNSFQQGGRQMPDSFILVEGARELSSRYCLAGGGGCGRMRGHEMGVFQPG